jgi:hypothetical protein
MLVAYSFESTEKLQPIIDRAIDLAVFLHKQGCLGLDSEFWQMNVFTKSGLIEFPELNKEA